jgi:hypothetical protein
MKYMKAIRVGQAVSLRNEPFFNSSESIEPGGTLYGTYFVWSNRVANGRVKITTDKSKVGIKGQELCWVSLTCLTAKSR